MLPPEHAAKLLLWYMQWSRDLVAKMHHRCLVILKPLPLPLIMSVVVLLNGGVFPMMHASYMTPVSVLVPVPVPQLSPHVHSYHPITPSLCTLGQQVITLLSRLIVLSHLMSLLSRL